MFEKEAEEYVIKKHNIDITKQPVDFSLRCEFAEDFTDFQRGAEFVYNKMDEWHDLRKNPSDLPEDGSYVLVWTEYGGITTHYGKECSDGVIENGLFLGIHISDVIAWKEFVPPKEEGNENN